MGGGRSTQASSIGSGGINSKAWTWAGSGAATGQAFVSTTASGLVLAFELKSICPSNPRESRLVFKVFSVDKT